MMIVLTILNKLFLRSMFVDFVLGWGANFAGIVKSGRVSKSLRTSDLDFTLLSVLSDDQAAKYVEEFLRTSGRQI